VANPTPDIVLGVALAADPNKYRAAVERLQRLSAERTAAAGADPAAFSETVEQARAGAAAVPRRVPASTPISVAVAISRQARPAGDAFGQLEAFVLQTFIQSMLPKNAQHVFGKGTAGDVWKSMLAEKIGNEIARSGQLGIAKRLAAGRLEVAAANSAPTPPNAGAAETVATQPSTPERS
jgi:hypothetical protein